MPDDRRDTRGESPSPDGEPDQNPPRLEPTGNETSGDRPADQRQGPATAGWQAPGARPTGSWQQPGPWQQPAIPGWQAHGTWQQAPGWRPPYGARPVPGTWQTPYAAWPQAGYGPPAYPGTWAPVPAPAPAAWPIGTVPWGYTNPPALPPVLEPPGSFHPPISKRRVFALRGRASPRLYALGVAVGLPGIAALLAYLVAVSAGFKLAAGPLPRWVTIEAVSIVAAVGLIGWAIAQARQRLADGWQDYSGPSPWLTLGAFVAVTAALDLPIEAALKTQGVDLESPSALVTLLLLLTYLAAYFGLVHFLVVRSGALTWREMARPQHLAPSSDDWGGTEPIPGWTRARGATMSSWRARLSGRRVGDILIPLAMVLPLMIASNVFSAAMLLALGLHPSDISPDTSVQSDALSMLVTFITVAIVAPIGEEVFFRGYATNAWGRSLSRNSAILRASLFFAFIHVMNTATTEASISWRAALFNLGARVPVAFALTWLYMRRRSILASGTLHAGYNGLITLISFL